MGGVPVAMPATPRQGRPEIFAVDWPAARPPPLAPPCRSRPCRRGEYGWVFEARGAVTRAGVVSRVWGSWWAGRRGDQGAREEEWARRLRLLRGEGRRAGTRAGPAGMGRLARVRCCRPGGARGASRRPCAPPPPPPPPRLSTGPPPDNEESARAHPEPAAAPPVEKQREQAFLWPPGTRDFKRPKCFLAARQRRASAEKIVEPGSARPRRPHRACARELLGIPAGTPSGKPL